MNKRIAALDVVRVIGIMLVMCLHSPVGPDGEATATVFFLRDFVAKGAVPVFFLLAGYLGARKLDAPDVSFREYAREKTRAYIVPFLFWNGLLLLAVLLAKGAGLESHWRGGGTYFDVDPNFRSITAALFGIGRFPIVFQFWFLRDLIVVSLASWWILRALPGIPLLAWLLFFVPAPMVWSLGYYLLGYQLRSLLSPEQFPSFRASWLYLSAWLVMGSGIFAGLVEVPFPLRQLGDAAFIFMLGIVLASASWGRRLAVLGPATFFIYAAHDPFQAILAKLWQASHLPGYDSVLCYLAIPAFVFGVLVLLYFPLSRMFPGLMRLATGERQWAKSAEPAK
jgi:fucose 4-O-acetylase-like acetyltransferase